MMHFGAEVYHWCILEWVLVFDYYIRFCLKLSLVYSLDPTSCKPELSLTVSLFLTIITLNLTMLTLTQPWPGMYFGSRPSWVVHFSNQTHILCLVLHTNCSE